MELIFFPWQSYVRPSFYHINFINPTMRGAAWRGKDSLRVWQLQKQTDGHHQRLRSIRPQSYDPEWEPFTLNPGKKQMRQQEKSCEIQKQNRYLLEKISTAMSKRVEKQKQTLGQGQRQRQKIMNRTLNTSYRKRQLDIIEVENARMLQRLSENKRSDYDTARMKEDWKKQKQMMKNIAAFPFVLRSPAKPNRRRTVSKQQPLTRPPRHSHALSSEIEMVRIRNISHHQFIVTVKLDQEMMTIIADQRKNLPKKIIHIPREQALAFVEGECLNKIVGVFDRLSYSEKEDVLYLVGSEEEGLGTIGQKKQTLEEDVLAGREEELGAVGEKKQTLVEEEQGTIGERNSTLAGEELGRVGERKSALEEGAGNI